MIFLKPKTNYIGLASEYDIGWLAQICSLWHLHRISVEKQWFQRVASSQLPNQTYFSEGVMVTACYHKFPALSGWQERTALLESRQQTPEDCFSLQS